MFRKISADSYMYLHTVQRNTNRTTSKEGLA